MASAATLAPMPSTAKTTRPPRTSEKYAMSRATSLLGVYRKSSCSNGDASSAGTRDSPPGEERLLEVGDAGVPSVQAHLPELVQDGGGRRPDRIVLAEIDLDDRAGALR